MNNNLGVFYANETVKVRLLSIQELTGKVSCDTDSIASIVWVFFVTPGYVGMIAALIKITKTYWCQPDIFFYDAHR